LFFSGARDSTLKILPPWNRAPLKNKREGRGIGGGKEATTNAVVEDPDCQVAASTAVSSRKSQSSHRHAHAFVDFAPFMVGM